MFFFIFFSELLKGLFFLIVLQVELMLLSLGEDVFNEVMNTKEAKTCEACKQPFKADLRAERQQRYCPMLECQRERRRRSQRLRRAAKSSLRKQNSEILAGGNKFSQLQSASRRFEAPMISEDPLIVGLIAMLCGTDNPDHLRTTMRSLKERGQTIMKERSDWAAKHSTSNASK